MTATTTALRLTADVEDGGTGRRRRAALYDADPREGYRAARQHAVSAAFREALAATDADAARSAADAYAVADADAVAKAGA